MSISSVEIEDWGATGARIGAAIGPVAWSWAAARNQQGAWQLTDFAVRAATDAHRRLLIYPDFVICTERLSPKSAAARWLAGKVGRLVSANTEFSLEPSVSNGSGSWWTTEPDSTYQTPAPDWPEFRIDWSIPVPGNLSISRPGNILSAPGQPLYPHVDAALAEHVYHMRPDQLHVGSTLTARVMIPDLRARIREVQFDDGVMKVCIEEGKRRGCRGLHLRATWRSRATDVRWAQFGQPLSGPGEVQVKTGELPEEMWVVVCSRTGQPLDRRGWDRLFGTRPHISGPLAAQVEGWIAQGEHQGLEYKQVLNDDKTRRRFADTVAAFANGAGGVVLVGVADDATIIGWDPPKARDIIADLLRNLILDTVTVQIERVEVGGKTIHVVVVHPGAPATKPYRSSGRVMVRFLGTTREASTSEIRRMTNEVQSTAEHGRWAGRL